jgi:hypothetical protein
MKINNFEKGTVLDTVEVDYYVPISLEFPTNDNKKEELYYYRFINGKSSFIEIKINSDTKKITGVTITSINDIADSEFPINKVSEENPVIETDIFAENTIITKEADFNIFRENKNLFFKLNEENLDSVVKMSKHLSLFLNVENEIIGMKFSDFSETEWSEINDSIQDSISLE